MRGAGARGPLGWLARSALALELFLAVGALAGGAALVAGQRGEIIPLKVSSLAGSPFDTFLVPGIVLFVVLGLGPLLAARLIAIRHPLAPLGVLVVGAALLIWLAVEIAIIGFSSDPPLQPIYLVLGVLLAIVGLAWLGRERGAVAHRLGAH